MCAQIGVRSTPGTSGCTIEPPAASEYAVEPVGVATITPSPLKDATKWSSQKQAISVRSGDGPRSTDTLACMSYQVLRCVCVSFCVCACGRVCSMFTSFKHT